MSLIIYHNPRCSKSRQTLDLLIEQGFKPTIVEYLKNPPSASELRLIVKRLGISPRELLRRTEPEYKAAGLENPNLSDKEIIAAMAKYPKLIQRPIVSTDDAAALGRPPENVLKILK